MVIIIYYKQLLNYIYKTKLNKLYYFGLLNNKYYKYIEFDLFVLFYIY